MKSAVKNVKVSEMYSFPHFVIHLYSSLTVKGRDERVGVRVQFSLFCYSSLKQSHFLPTCIIQLSPALHLRGVMREWIDVSG